MQNKIKYFFIEDLPGDLKLIDPTDNLKSQNNRKRDNALIRENFQRNMIVKGLIEANDEDFILIGDIDEIPNLKNLNLTLHKKNIVIFKQLMFYYKFNLNYKDFTWHGTKGCTKKNLKSPQWLRNIKNKKYNIFRFDILFSQSKYNNIKFIDSGGWHFSNIMDAESLFQKLKTFLHHVDFEESNLSVDDIKMKIKDNLIFYNHGANSSNDDKWSFKKKLHKIDNTYLPNYIKNNLSKFSNWIE